MRAMILMMLAIATPALAGTWCTESGECFTVPEGKEVRLIDKTAPATLYDGRRYRTAQPKPSAEDDGACDNYDFLDGDRDGVIDFGPNAGCEYDPCTGSDACY